jgi:SOS-response transcriptional repressor LexA
LISPIQAGHWSEICDNFQPGDAEKWVPCHVDLGPCGYVLRVRGASMTAPEGSPYSFPDGMLVYVHATLEPVPGQFVIARRNKSNEATFKKYVLIEGHPYLEALNPNWPERFIKMEEGDQFCGVVKHAGFEMP